MPENASGGGEGVYLGGYNGWGGLLCNHQLLEIKVISVNLGLSQINDVLKCHHIIL